MSFTADELENSFPIDTGRKFRESANVTLLNSILEEMEGREQRQRKRAATAENRWVASIEALLANLVAAHLNVIDPSRFVAVSFNHNDYNSTELSCDAMKQCREYLYKQDLIEVAPGFQRWDANGIGKFTRRTRLRATPRLRSWIDNCGLNDRSLTRTPRQLIQIKGANANIGNAPVEVENSRSLLEAVNARLMKADIRLDKAMPPALIRRIVENEGEEADAAYRKRSYAGDLAAVSLYRVFKYDWRSGGRIYGGWWMSLPRFARAYLTIDNSPTVELDYKALHPLLLYHREHKPMPDDPYLVEPWKSSGMRDVGKRTFNRLLNRKEVDPAKLFALRAAPEDREPLNKVPFKEYLTRFASHLSGVANWFGTGAGLGLQYEDSVLALDVLRRMEDQGIVVLPIHDSFIVAQEYEAKLADAMKRAFHHYGIIPKISRKGPSLLTA